MLYDNHEAIELLIKISFLWILPNGFELLSRKDLHLNLYQLGPCLKDSERKKKSIQNLWEREEMKARSIFLKRKKNVKVSCRFGHLNPFPNKHWF